MDRSLLYVSTALVGVALVVMFAVFSIQTNERSEETAIRPPMAVSSAEPIGSENVSISPKSAQGLIGPSSPSVASASIVQPSAGGRPDAQAKDVVLQEIFSAMITYSEEGVERLSSFLGNADPEINRAAVEALKQIGGPSSARALRTAAAAANTKVEKDYFNEAAKFVELPVFDPKKRKQKRKQRVEVREVD